MKKCPYCAEEIQEEAIKCRYCNEFLDESKRPAPATPPPLPDNAPPWYFKTGFIVLTFVILPPLALPLVCLHPRLHWAWKVVLSLAIVAASWIAYIAFQGFLQQLDDAKKMLERMGY